MEGCVRRAVIVAGIAVIVLSLLPLLGHPWVFHTLTLIDVNSGDTLLQTYVCGFQVGEEVQTTPFSREVRRIGVPISGTPRWERVRMDVFIRRPVSYRYSSAVSKCNFLIELLQVLDLTETERLPIIEMALHELQSQNVKGLDALLDRYGDQLSGRRINGHVEGQPFDNH